VFNVVLAPEGSTLDYTDRYMRQVEAIYKKTPGVEAFFSAVGLGFGGPGRVTDGFMFVRLKPYNERKFTQQQIVGMLFPQLMGIPGVLAIPINLPSLGGGFGSPVQFVLQADTYDELQRAMGPFMMEAQKLGYLLNMNTDLKLDKPQLEIQIDRDAASALGVSVSDVGNTLQTLLGGREVTRFQARQQAVRSHAPGAAAGSVLARGDRRGSTCAAAKAWCRWRASSRFMRRSPRKN
jgi:multidrug efflux pump subunit AcrB